MKKRLITAFTLKLMTVGIVCVVFANPLWAGWTWSAVQRPGASASYLQSISGDDMVGSIMPNFSVDTHATLWSRTTGALTDLHPAGKDMSSAHACAGGRQVGVVSYRSDEHAALWSGTAESFIDLHPSWAYESTVNGTDGAYQVGTLSMPLAPNEHDHHSHAALWSGTRESCIDLNPASSSHSAAVAVDSGQQVGTTMELQVSTTIELIGHASLWTGTADSWIDLNPSGAKSSAALGVSKGVQAGWASFQTPGATEAPMRAGVWTGTAGSWRNLHPAGFYQSACLGIDDGIAVGQAVLNNDFNNSHAYVWFTSTGSGIDLHTYLASSFAYSMARGIEVDGNDIWIVGQAWNDQMFKSTAVVWHTTVPEPSSLLALASGIIGVAGLTLRRRNEL